MKYLFAAMFVFLGVCSLWLHAQMPEGKTDRQAVIYWTTDANPARQEQIAAFDAWQIRNGHVDERGVPLVDLVLDTGNRGREKQIIQGVSGVAGDVMDLWAAAGEVQYLSAIGILHDATADAERLGFDTTQTYPAVVPELVVRQADGSYRQYAFPCNVAHNAIPYVNKQAFRDVGMEPPSGRWTVEEFERIGKEWVARANKGTGNWGRSFFIDRIDTDTLVRSFGVDRFNETLTRSTVDSPGAVAALELIRKWTYEDRIVPSSADRSGFAAEGGYGGGSPQLFERGRFALFSGGRYHLIRFRQANIERVKAGQEPLEFGMAEPPHAGFPNDILTTRCAAVYVAGDVKHTVLFMAFLASEEYNRQIAFDADALPPNPIYAGGEEFLRPPTDPERGVYPQTEHEVHGAFLEAAQNTSIAPSHSPFILTVDASRDFNLLNDQFMAYMVPSAQEAMTEAARRINARIERNIEANPRLRERYERALADQSEIDRLKAEGKPIPARLIANPYHLAYYRSTGMLLEEAGAAPGQPSVAPSTAPSAAQSAAQSAAAR